MSITNIVRAVVKPGSDYTVTSPIMKEDKGQVLLIEGLDLPEVYEIDFSNDRHHGSSITMIGNADGVLIPTQFIKTGRDVFAFYYYVGDGFGQTEHIFRLPNDYRPDRTEEVPEPEQESLIDRTIAELNAAVDKAEEARQDILDMSVSAETLAEGSEATVSKTEVEGVAHISFGIPTGATGAKGDKGDKGEKGDKGDTGATGAKGEQGERGLTGQDGISPTVTITPITGGHRITITDADGEHSADVMDGTGNVDDVQINGTSIVEDGVANVPIATTTSAGAMSAQDKGRLDSVYEDYSSALTALGVI